MFSSNGHFRAPSNQVCFAFVTSTEQPKPILNTRKTTFLFGGKIAPRVLASITFCSDVKNPTVGPRYISVYYVKSGVLIQQIDSFNKSLVSVSADSRTVFFEINAYFLKEKYEIVFEEGVVVGASAFCSGRGPVAQGILAGEWTFILLSDYCASATVTCNESSICFRTWKGVRCQCKNVFEEDGLTRCEDIDECLSHIHNCHKHAECQDTLGSFTCTCRSGYSGDGIVCRDVDECTSGSDNCPKNANCNNTLGSYDCVCQVGFSGTGSACLDVNECNEKLDFQCDDLTQHCVNTNGGYDCACKEGYSVDSVATTAPSRPVCQRWGICSNVTGTFKCACLSGLARSEEICVDVDECSSSASNNCHQYANCLNTFRSYKCQCIDGYPGNGTYCEVSSPSSFPVTTTIAVIVSVFVLGLLFVAGMCTYRRRRKMFSHAEITSL